MKTSDFYYDLPAELIAQKPLTQRTASRLLVLDAPTGDIEDCFFTDITDFLTANDLLVFNNTRVIPARLHGRKASGGKVEVLVERIIGEHQALAHLRVSKPPKMGSNLWLEDALKVQVSSRKADLFELQFPATAPVLSLLERYGHIPLPPYIQRPDTALDKERYQTVYAHKPGAVAAPTAGLHFDDALLTRLQRQGINRAFVTLHVGAGTFQPVRMENPASHVMHAERVEVDEKVCLAVAECRARGGRVIAVGTTTVRSLEAAVSQGRLEPFSGDARLFICPGYDFKVIDAIITNFHLPESTLLMLVAAFAGYPKTMAAYCHAVQQHYRFFSYGDALFVRQRHAF